MSRTDKTIEDFRVGDTVSFTRRYSSSDFEQFSVLSGDQNPLHHNLEYAAASRFHLPIVPLHLVAAPLSAVAGMVFPGHRSLYLASQIKAVNPAYYDRDITYTAQVCRINLASSVLVVRALAFSENKVLLDGELQIQVRNDKAPEAWQDASTYSITNIHRDRWALITGATGHIGRAVALRLAKAGWNLVLQGRQVSSLGELELRCGSYGAVVKSMAVSLTDTSTLTAKLSKLPPIEGFVHCASPGLDAPLEDLLAINAVSLKTLANTLLPGMLRRQKGRIVLIGSSALQYLPPEWEDYIAAKAAATAIVNSLHQQYSSYGIQGITVAPGFVETPFSVKVRPMEEVVLLPEEVAEAVEASLSAQCNENYWWLEASGVRRGQYGFHERGMDTSNPEQTDKKAVAASETTPSQNSTNELEGLIREYLGLPEFTDVSEGGLNLTAGWDSLMHIRLLLFLEERTGLHFSSHEIEQTRRVSDLKALINDKQT